MISSADILKTLNNKVLRHHAFAHDFTSISTDSRTCETGSLFVSLEKSSNKAHEYAEAAIARGALGVLSQHDWTIKQTSLFVVHDADDAFYHLAGIWRQQFNIPVIAVAGNVGKTTTKEMIAHLLETSGKKVLKTEDSQNGFQGIPVTLTRLRPEHEALVIEVGIDEPNVMSSHALTVKPTHVIIVSLGAEHLEKLKDPDTAAREEFELVLWGHQNGASIVLNGDNQYCQSLSSKYLKDGDFVFYSLDPSARNRISKRLRCLGSYKDQILKVVDLSTDKTFQLISDLPGTHNALNLLGAFTTVLSTGIDLKKIQESSEKFKLAKGRSELRTGAKGATFLCDYYNASPQSMAAAFATIDELRTSNFTGRIWLCLGDMLDLGGMEETYHRQLAEVLPRESVLFSFGRRMMWVQDQLAKERPEAHRQHFESLAEMAQALYRAISPADLILIKGSRGMKMETVWNEMIKLEACIADK